jgi:hypothetical protein
MIIESADHFGSIQAHDITKGEIDPNFNHMDEQVLEVNDITKGKVEAHGILEGEVDGQIEEMRSARAGSSEETKAE